MGQHVHLGMRAAVVHLCVLLLACGSSEEGAQADTVGTEPDLVEVSDDTAAADAEAADTSDTTDASDTGATPETDTSKDQPDMAEVADSEPEVGPEVIDAGTSIAERCFPGIDPAELSGPQYDQFTPVIGSHCLGTDHQAIEGIEEVVFLGDSVTVGTPNLGHILSIDNEHFYRNLLAEWLADHFGLDRGDGLAWGLWKAYDYFSGKGAARVAGDFRNCSKWGARTDDLLEGGQQLAECFPEGGSEDKTLVIFTMGGNDIAKITQVGAEASEEEVAAGYPEVRALADQAVAHLESAVAWLADPERFPNGAYVVFGNPFEFTDATGQTDACSPQTKLDIPGIGEIDLADFELPVASLAGFGEWADPDQQKEIVIGLLEGYMRVAARYGVDLVFVLEHFCGHGYVAAGARADPQNACYQGPDAELWFDETCIHPSDDGHRALYEMFRAVITE